MILEITLENLFSIKDKISLDLRSANINTEKAKNLPHNLITFDKESILKSIAIYGANASGKTNIIRSIRYCCYMILESHLYNENSRFNFSTFKFYDKKEAKFSILFILEKIKYEYSFSFKKSEILTESLYYYPQKKKSKIFTRDETKKNVYSFSNVIKRPNDVSINTSKKTLYISRASQMNREIPKNIFNFFNQKFILNYQPINNYRLENFLKNKKEILLEYLQKASTDIVNIDFEKKKIKHTVVNLKNITIPNIEKNKEVTTPINYQEETALIIKTYHKPNPNVPFNFMQEESNGTINFFYVLINLIDIIENNKMLIIDEIETSLHSEIIKWIINFFHNKENQSQLIFSTHNTNLLSFDLFRKDQIYFVEKTDEGFSNLYSLYDFKDFRENMDMEKAYLKGRFGAIPFVDNF